MSPILGATALAADPTVAVKPGDTLTSLAKRHAVPIRRLVELNDLADPNRIYAGQRLRLAASRAGASRAAPARSAAPAAAASHTVRPGEHLIGIARRYGVSVSAIVTANRIANASRIFVGQRLAIPGSASTAAPRAAAPATPPAAARTHTVSSGEHLTGIAHRYGVSVSAITAANGIANASRIFAGQRLAIPVTSSTPSAPARSAAPARAAAMPASMAQLMARREDVRRLIVAEARRQGVPKAFALAVAWQESGWQQGVVSSAGAIGVMQLMPDTAEWIGAAMLGRAVNPRDLEDNVRAGVRLLRHYLDRYDGKRDLVLAAYYQGQGAVDRHGIYPVSRPYIASIAVLVRLFGG